jgi:hypothetical protein
MVWWNWSEEHSFYSGEAVLRGRDEVTVADEATAELVAW